MQPAELWALHLPIPEPRTATQQSPIVEKENTARKPAYETCVSWLACYVLAGAAAISLRAAADAISDCMVFHELASASTGAALARNCCMFPPKLSRRSTVTARFYSAAAAQHG